MDSKGTQNRLANEAISEHTNQRALLLQKIRDLLNNADPDTWRKGGDDFVNGSTHEKTRQTWEEVYTLEISKGTLVFRRSTSVKSEFLGRGFILTRSAPADYFVELRAKGWHHSELTDPYKRSRTADRTMNVLAEGSIAEELFNYVTDSYNNYHNQCQAEFDREALNLAKILLEQLQSADHTAWQKNTEEPGQVKYRGKMADCEVEVFKLTDTGRDNFQLVFKRGRELSKIRDLALAREIFLAVEELGQTSRLLTLSKALENL